MIERQVGFLVSPSHAISRRVLRCSPPRRSVKLHNASPTAAALPSNRLPLGAARSAFRRRQESLAKHVDDDRFRRGPPLISLLANHLLQFRSESDIHNDRLINLLYRSASSSKDPVSYSIDHLRRLQFAGREIADHFLESNVAHIDVPHDGGIIQVRFPHGQSPARLPPLFREFPMAKHAAKSQKSLFDQDTAETSPVTEIEHRAISGKENVGKEDALNSLSLPPSSFLPSAVGYAPHHSSATSYQSQSRA